MNTELYVKMEKLLADNGICVSAFEDLDELEYMTFVKNDKYVQIFDNTELGKLEVLVEIQDEDEEYVEVDRKFYKTVNACMKYINKL